MKAETAWPARVEKATAAMANAGAVVPPSGLRVQAPLGGGRVLEAGRRAVCAAQAGAV